MQQGLGVSRGIAIGKAFVILPQTLEIPQDLITDTQQELERLHHVLQTTKKELEHTYAEALEKLEKNEAQVFAGHLTILQDEYSIVNPISGLITDQRFNVAKAVHDHLENLVELFASSDDDYMSQRALDFIDIKTLLLKNALAIDTPSFSTLDEDTIIVADMLTPSDTVQMDLEHVVGFITSQGGPTSHTAIIARNLAIPSVTNIENATVCIQSGDTLIVDGDSGTVIVCPTDEVQRGYETQKLKQMEEKKRLSAYIHQPSITKDGQKKLLQANVGSSKEALNAKENGADGIGLFRSEFLFLERTTLPSEEEQYTEYATTLEIMGERPVTIRTLDVGGDKSLPLLDLPSEENPFLGYRAIRLCLDQPSLFKPQLRALLRASAHGNLQIMFPMIATIGEFERAKEILEECRQELILEGKAVGTPKVGIMIEIPSVAIMANELAKAVDFFSIGTNDLIQYTVAVDRGNPKVTPLYHHYHPSVLRLIQHTINAAKENDISCGMCGEMAGDFHLMPLLVGMGLTEFSMNAPSIPQAREYLSRLDEQVLSSVVEDILSAKDIKAALQAYDMY